MPRLKQRADGRYRRSITDSSGNIKYVYGATEREVNAKVAALKEDGRRGPLFIDVAEAWWVQALRERPANAEKSYGGAYKRVIEWFGNSRTKNITVRDVEEYLNYLATLRVTTKTIKNYKVVLNLILNDAVREGIIDVNPCYLARIPKGAPSKKRSSASHSDEELIKRSWNVWLFPYFALHTGMRRGEILALQWRDIDMDNDIITVNKSIGFDLNRPYVKETKTEAGNRFVLLLSPLKEKLVPGEPEEYVFSSGKDRKKPMTEKEYLCKWKAYAKATGVKCTAHQLRHSFATFCFEAGLNEKVIQTMLGHTKISTTVNVRNPHTNKM